MDFSKISKSVVKPPLTFDDFKKGITKYGGDNSWNISLMPILKVVSNYLGWTQEFHAKYFITKNKDRFTAETLRTCCEEVTPNVKAAVSAFLDPSDQTNVKNVADSLYTSIENKNTGLRDDLLESLSKSKDPSKVLESLRTRNDNKNWKAFQSEIVGAAKAFLEPSVTMTEEKKKQLNFLVRIMDADSVHTFLVHALQYGSIDKISFIKPHAETLKQMVAVTQQQQNEEQQQIIGHTRTIAIANALKVKIPEFENNPSALLDTLNYLAPALNALPPDKLVETELLKAIMDTGDVKCIETIMNFPILKQFSKDQLAAFISIQAIQFDSAVMNAVVNNMPHTPASRALLAGWKAAEDVSPITIFTALNDRANQILTGLGSLYPNVKKIENLSSKDVIYLKNAVQGGDIKTVDPAISIEVRQYAISLAKSPECILAILQSAPDDQRNSLIESVLLRAVARGDSSTILNVLSVYREIPSQYVEKAYKLASIRHLNLKDLLKGRVDKNKRRKIDENIPSYKDNIQATVDNLLDAELITEIVKSTASCKAFCEMFPQMFALLTDAQRNAIADNPLLLKAIMESGDRECIQAIMKIPALKTMDQDKLAQFIKLAAIQADNPGLIRDVVDNMPRTDAGKALLRAWTNGPYGQNQIQQTPEETQFVFTTLAACANDTLEELESLYSLYSSIEEPKKTLNSDEIKYLKLARNGTIPQFTGQRANISLDVTRYAISLAKNADNVLAILQSACNNGLLPSYTEEEKRKLIETALLRAVALGDSSTISRVLAWKCPSSYAIQENTLQKAYKLAKIRKDASSIASLSGKIDKDVKNQIDTITESYQGDIENNVMRLLDNENLLAKIGESKELCADFCNMLPKMLPLLSSAQRKKFGGTLAKLERMKNRKGFQRILQLFLSFFPSDKKNAEYEWLKTLRAWEQN